MFREIYNLHSTLIASNDNISMPVDKIMIWAKTSFHLFEERRFLYENVLEEEWHKIFYYVAKYHNFTKAAQALNNSQPNITRAMNCLEQQLNTTLFIRTNRGVQLTPEGERLYTHVLSAMEQFQAAEEELADSSGLSHGSVAIGASETALNIFLLDKLKSFHMTYPGIRLKLYNHSTPEARNFPFGR